MIFETINLQLFADVPGGGVVVNTTTGDVNAYTGAANSTTAMAPELKTFYDTELLENARVEMFYAQFAKKQPLPQGRGKQVEWRKWNVFQRAEKLVEGVIPKGQKFGITSINASIDQYGTYASISDQLELHAYDDVILGATEEMGASAAETQEMLIRDALLSNPNVLYCDTLDAAGAFKSTPLKPSDLAHTPTNGYSYLTPNMVAKAATKLKKDRVPTISGKYVAVVHPSVAYDLRNSKEWIEAHKYAATTEIFNGEIGELHGVRFVEDNFAPILSGTIGTTNYTTKDSGVSYATYFFGKDAFGIIDPAGGALQMIVHDKSEAGGPLNQFSTIGYKFETNGATVLYPERVLCVLSASTYSDTDKKN